MIEKLITQNRSTRRFIQSEQISTDTLRWLVNLGRLSPSGGNLQPLKYIITNDLQQNEKIFTSLRWEGYLSDWKGPSEGEKPAAYITILNDSDISKNPGCDQGIAAQSILLGAAEKGIAGCMIGNIDRKELRNTLSIPERYDISLVLALGKPNENIALQDITPDADIKYYRDQNDRHIVPKRKLDDIIIAGE